MKITYLAHAAMLVESGGKRILMDPWLNDPTYHGTWWHYPPLALGVRDLPPVDYIYISHEHPDHFDPPTLRLLDKKAQVIIARFKNRRFHDLLKGLGFETIHELEFGTWLDWAPRNTLRLIAPDRAWDDSAIQLSDGETTVLNVNDCHLDEATLARLGAERRIDIAFLTFTGASQYPGCYEYPIEEKLKRWQVSKKAHLDEFVQWAKLLQTKRAVPAAGNYALLHPDQLPFNTGEYVSHPQEALDLLAKAAPGIEGLQMNPGDVWTPEGGHTRLHPAPNWQNRIEEIRALSAARAPLIAEYFERETAAPADLYERFRTYFNEVLDAETARRIGIVMWWKVEGPSGGDWTIDFRRSGDWISKGEPTSWNLKLTIPDKLVAKGVGEEAPWEDLILSFRIRLARQPDVYPKDFWTWFSRMQGRKYLTRAAAA